MGSPEKERGISMYERSRSRSPPGRAGAEAEPDPFRSAIEKGKAGIARARTEPAPGEKYRKQEKRNEAVRPVGSVGRAALGGHVDTEAAVELVDLCSFTGRVGVGSGPAGL
eukprot:gene12700-biopygen13341